MHVTLAFGYYSMVQQFTLMVTTPTLQVTTPTLLVTRPLLLVVTLTLVATLPVSIGSYSACKLHKGDFGLITLLVVKREAKMMRGQELKNRDDFADPKRELQKMIAKEQN